MEPNPPSLVRENPVRQREQLFNLQKKTAATCLMLLSFLLENNTADLSVLLTMLVEEKAARGNVARPPRRVNARSFLWSRRGQQPADQLVQLTRLDLRQAKIPQVHSRLWKKCDTRT